MKQQSEEACNFIQKETLAQVFSCEFCEIFKNTCFGVVEKEPSTLEKDKEDKNFISAICLF